MYKFSVKMGYNVGDTGNNSRLPMKQRKKLRSIYLQLPSELFPYVTWRLRGEFVLNIKKNNRNGPTKRYELFFFI